MTYYLYLLKAIAYKNIIYMWRYKFNTIFSIIIWCLLFGGIILGLNKWKSEDFNVITILGGYITWIIMTSSFSGIVNRLVSEANLGTLEQLYCYSRSFYNTILYQGVADLIILLIQITLIIILILPFCNSINFSFLFQFLYSLPIIILGVFSLWGVSLLIGAIALNYKNVSALYATISSILFAYSTYQVHNSMLFCYLMPFGLANLKMQVYFDQDIYPTVLDFLYILSNSCFYLILGLIVFRYYEQRAKINGKFSKH